MTGCQRRTPEATESTAYGVGADTGPKAQFFTVNQDQMTHLQVVTVEPTVLKRVLRLTGSVAYNSFETTPVITQIGGPVSRVLAYPGEQVSVRQPLLYVSSPDYAQLRTNYLKARDALSLAQKNYERSLDLYAHHAISQADLLTAESVRNQAQADLQFAEQALRILGLKPEIAVASPVSPEIPVLAPISGEVVERLVAPGQVIQAGATQVFTISNMKTVWVLINVYESNLAYIREGEPVTIQTDAYTDVFHGRISYVAPSLDPDTRTLQVRIVTPNPGQKLKKDMYVTATVEAGGIRNALAVPDTAVLRTAENQPFVYVAVGANQFAQRVVSIGESENGKTQIASGLKPGERVAADGSLFLQFANSFQR
jgi:cobalt-zinc-cadmium efflux system membrane fusion protein